MPIVNNKGETPSQPGEHRIHKGENTQRGISQSSQRDFLGMMACYAGARGRHVPECRNKRECRETFGLPKYRIKTIGVNALSRRSGAAHQLQRTLFSLFSAHRAASETRSAEGASVHRDRSRNSIIKELRSRSRLPDCDLLRLNMPDKARKASLYSQGLRAASRASAGEHEPIVVGTREYS